MSAILALETGQIFRGCSVGVSGMTVGELVFNTALTGYQEILTDPSYAEQIITFTYPHIGNTGINNLDSQSTKIYARGMVVKSISKFHSNWRANISLLEFLKQQKTIAISGIDTRGLTKILRQHGVMRCCIMAGTTDDERAINSAREYPGLDGVDLTAQVSTTKAYTLNPSANLHIVLLDFGVKEQIKKSLVDLGCRVTVVAAQTTASEVLAFKPDGVLLSNGPGDPAACTAIIENIQQLIAAQLPIFGICLGHQLLGLALGAKTYKMNFGHHGSNHPVQDLVTKKVLITSQNHGYAIHEATLNSELQVTHRSLFDQSLQGFKHTQIPIFGFQGHPEAAPGPHDALGLFGDFINAVRNQHAKT